MLPSDEIYKLFMLYCVSVISSSWVYFTAAEVLASKDTSRVSVLNTSMYAVVAGLYLGYGLVERDRVLALGSLIALVGAAFLLVIILVYSQ